MPTASHRPERWSLQDHLDVMHGKQAGRLSLGNIGARPAQAPPEWPAASRALLLSTSCRTCTLHSFQGGHEYGLSGLVPFRSA